MTDPTINVPYPLSGVETVALAPILPFGNVTDTESILGFDPRVVPCLVVTGDGKSNVVDILAAAARLQGSTVYGIRASGIGDLRFTALASGLESAESVAASSHAQLRDRVAAVAESGAISTDDIPADQRPEHIFIIVEDLENLLPEEPTPEGFDPDERADEYFEYLVLALDKFARIGSLARIHVILAVADPSLISATFKKQSGLLICAADGTAVYHTPDVRNVPVDLWPSPSTEQLVGLLGE
jgi:hypothetical protein